MAQYHGIPVDNETYIKLECIRLKLSEDKGKTLTKGDFLASILNDFVDNYVPAEKTSPVRKLKRVN